MVPMLIKTGVAALELARGKTLRLIEDIPESELCRPAWEGGNHTLWVLGHLAWTDDYFMQTVGKRPTCLPDGWADRFGMGSTPVATPADYPAPAEVRDRLGSSRAALIDWFQNMDASQAETALPEALADFAPHFAGLASTLAWHEGLHAGQLTVIRRHLGLGPTTG